MSKRSKARREEMIRSMEGLAVLKEPESKPAGSKAARPKVGPIAGLIAGVILASTALWWLLH